MTTTQTKPTWYLYDAATRRKIGPATPYQIQAWVERERAGNYGEPMPIGSDGQVVSPHRQGTPEWATARWVYLDGR